MSKKRPVKPSWQLRKAVGWAYFFGFRRFYWPPQRPVSVCYPLKLPLLASAETSSSEIHRKSLRVTGAVGGPVALFWPLPARITMKGRGLSEPGITVRFGLAVSKSPKKFIFLLFTPLTLFSEPWAHICKILLFIIFSLIT